MRRIILALLGFLGASGCQPTGPLPEERIMVVGWFHHDFSPGPDLASSETPRGDRSGILATGWIGGIPDAVARDYDTYVVAHAHLFSVTTASAVPGEWRIGGFRLSGEPIDEALPLVSFVAEHPLEDGWYVAAVDLREWMAAHPEFFPQGLLVPYSEDGWMYTRFQVGTSPTWTMSGVHNDYMHEGRGRSSIAAFTSNAMFDSANPFSLLVDGQADPRCEEWQFPERGGLQYGWDCPLYSDDTRITIRLARSDMVSALGGATTHTVRVGDFRYTTTAWVDPRFGIDLMRGAP